MAAASPVHSLELDELRHHHWMIKSTSTSVLTDAVSSLSIAAKDVMRMGGVVSATVARGEISLLLPTPQSDALSEKHGTSLQKSGPYTVFRVRGPLDFALVGIMAGMTAALASARISVLALSTYDTDFLCVAAEFADKAIDALSTPDLANGMIIKVQRSIVAPSV